MARRPRQRDLVNGAIGPTLLAFAMPTLGSSILQSLNGSINTVWVGRFLGEDALAATSNANMVMFLLMAFIFGFGMAAMVLVGQACGRGDIGAARRAMGAAIGTFVPVSAAIAVLGWIGAPLLLRLLGTPADSVPLALAYVRVIFLAMPPIMLSALLTMGLRGTGDAMTPLWFMLLSAVLDAGLNPVLILGLGPAPAMGIAGSAAATVIANIATLIGLVAYIYWRDLPLRLRGHELAFLRPDPALARTIVAKGLPMGLQMIVISSAGLATVGLVNREGVATAAAFGVAMQLWAYVQMPAIALGGATGAMAAQNIGAGRWDRLGAITRAGIIYNLLITGALVLLLWLIARPALALFLGGDSAALPVAQHILLLTNWSFLLFGITMVLFGTIRANGAVIAPLIIMTIGLYPIRLGFMLGFHPILGSDALWLSYPVGAIAVLAMATVYYLRGGWKRGRMGGPLDPTEAVEEAAADGEPSGRLCPSG